MHKYVCIFILLFSSSLFGETVTTNDGRIIKLNEDGTYSQVEITETNPIINEDQKNKLDALNELYQDGIINEVDYNRIKKGILSVTGTDNSKLENKISDTEETIKLLLKLIDLNYQTIDFSNDRNFIIKGINFSNKQDGFETYITKFEVKNLNTKYIENISSLNSYKGRFFDKIIIDDLRIVNIKNNKTILSLENFIIDRFDFEEMELLYQLINNELNYEPPLLPVEHLKILDEANVNELTKLGNKQISKALSGKEIRGVIKYGNETDTEAFEYREIYYSNGSFFYSDYNLNDKNEIYEDTGVWEINENQICYKIADETEFICSDLYEKINRGKSTYYWHEDEHGFYAKSIPEISQKNEDLLNAKNIFKLIHSIDIKKFSITKLYFDDEFNQKYFYDDIILTNIRNSNLGNITFRNFKAETSEITYLIKLFEIDEFHLKNFDLAKIDWDNNPFEDPIDLLYIFDSVKKISCIECYTVYKSNNLRSGSQKLEISNIIMEDFGEYRIPTSINIIVEGSIDLSFISQMYDEEFKKFLEQLNYDEIKISQSAKVKWDTKANTFSVNQILNIDEVVSINFNGQITNLDKYTIASNFYNDESMEEYIMNEPKLKMVELIIKDDSLTDRLISYFAFNEEVSENTFRTRLINNLQGDPNIKQMNISSDLINTIISFIENPRKIVIEIKPVKPLNARQIYTAGIAGPDMLIELLGLQIRN